MLRKIPETDDEGGAEISLNPCPFCGKDVSVFTNCQELELCSGEVCRADSHYYCVVCSFHNGGCGASSGFHPTCREAAEAWNKRSACEEKPKDDQTRQQFENLINSGARADDIAEALRRSTFGGEKAK